VLSELSNKRCSEVLQTHTRHVGGDNMQIGDLVRVAFDGHSTIGVVIDPCYYINAESTCYKIKAYAWGEVYIFDSYSVVRI
jgi:hypothetical protein